MNKPIIAMLISFMLMFVAPTTLSANHADVIQGDAAVAEVSYDYSSPGMARFLFLKQAADRKDALLESLGRWSEQQDNLIHNLMGDQGAEGALSVILVFIAMIVIGLFFEKTIGYKLNAACDKLTGEKREAWQESLSLLLMRLAFRYLGLAVFAVSSCILPLIMYEASESFRLLTLNLLGLIVKIRALAILLELVLAPYASGLRLIKMECHDAFRFYYWILSFISFYLISTTMWRLVAELKLEPIMFALIVPLNGLLLNIASICFVWFNRKSINRLFTSKQQHTSPFTQTFSQIWPTIITFWLLVIWTIWAINEFLGNYDLAEQLTPAWWLTFSFPILDRIIFVILSQLKKISWLQSFSFERRCDVFINRVIVAIRALLLTVVVYHIVKGFGYNTWEMLADSLGSVLAKSVDVVIVLIIAYAVWEVIQSAIERHLPHDAATEDGMSSLEGEGGGSGASRSETLLPLVRSFLMVFLLVCVILTVLSIIGVEIAPLLAGAGIVGIAVGFGAQKLVQDVISGIFFLLDDAFRRGEYIEAAGLRGTVERISIRSIRLRHHLGAVQTIPFSEMATVTNLSRDWITMKLEFRLDYNTDVEKVRKLIKKVGQKMLEHEEYGQYFLLPLKSQGVIRVEESALIFRMKFTCVPGEQWIIRREAFTQVKNSLESNGIHFAHRSVHVLMQEQQNAEVVDLVKQTTEMNRLAGAAALSVTPEITRQNKIDDDKANAIGLDADSV